MDSEILFRYLKIEFEEFFINSGFEIHSNKASNRNREIYLFCLKYGNKETINVLDYNELPNVKKKQFRTSFGKYQEFVNFEENLVYNIDPTDFSAFLEDSLIASNIAHIVSKSIADCPVILIKWQEKADKEKIINDFKSMGVKNYFDKMFILTGSEELLKWTMSMKDSKDMFLDSYISLIKASEGKIVVDKVIM